MGQFLPESKAIGLPFSPKITVFHNLPISNSRIKCSKNGPFLPKSKAIGLPFSPQIVVFHNLPISNSRMKCSKNGPDFTEK